jgi:hypothetical protein
MARHVDHVGAMPRLACLVALAAFVAAPGCAHEPKSILVARPDDRAADAAITQLWTREIHDKARDGDWLLSRSYYVMADAITAATPGEDISHASIYDAKHDTVIESIGSGVREIPLADLVARNHFMIIVRPTGMTAADESEALTRARSQVGAKYDIGGMFGVDAPEKFYCSELVYWASQTEARSGRRERVITPSDLMRYGEVIYWSGKRTDPQVVELATSRQARHAAPQTATAPQ